MASLDRNIYIYIPLVGNRKELGQRRSDINRGLALHLRGENTRERKRKKRKSGKQGDKSVIFEDASSILCTSLWMDVRLVVMYAEMSPEIVERVGDRLAWYTIE